MQKKVFLFLLMALLLNNKEILSQITGDKGKTIFYKSFEYKTISRKLRKIDHYEYSGNHIEVTDPEIIIKVLTDAKQYDYIPTCNNEQLTTQYDNLLTAEGAEGWELSFVNNLVTVNGLQKHFDVNPQFTDITYSELTFNLTLKRENKSQLPPLGFKLTAGTGFTDGNNTVNMYASDLYFIHGDDRFSDKNTGYFNIRFDTIVSNFHQLEMSLTKIKPNTPFTLHLRIWANLNHDYNANCTFYIKKNNDNGSTFEDKITFKEAHIPLLSGESKDLEIKFTNNELSPNGVYYLSITGLYANTNLWYEISKITLTYN